MPLYEDGGTMIFKEEEAELIRNPEPKSGNGTARSITSEVCIKTTVDEAPPSFMKYMAGMNMDVIDKGYLNSHFQEEEEE